MHVRKWCALGLATLLGGSALAQTPSRLPSPSDVNSTIIIVEDATGPAKPQAMQLPPGAVVMQEAPAPAAPKTATGAEAQAFPESQAAQAATAEGEAPKEEAWGPTPLNQVKILQNCLADKCDLFAETEDPCTGKKKGPCLLFSGWIDMDYTYRSTGPGQTFLAPVMNRFGDELLMRQIGLYLSKPLDPKELSFGFNSIFIAGSDASFLGPTAGGWANTNPRFGGMWTDLNVTAHLPILTEGGVDVKAGRQTTVLGPMGALPWQRYFTSSDYTWYNEEEGRYTGVSANWHITKRLDWYNAIEFGGWGVFFTGFNKPSGPDYLGQINYWLDEEAKKTLLTFTVLTGPTGFTNNGNTTVVEVCIHQNWNKYVYQVIDTHLLYSKAPLFFTPPAGYQERSYSIYNYLGFHLSKEIDLNTRVEWYRDVDGGGYPGGFGVPKTNYWEVTVGVDYHPVKWLQLRPEIRYDFSNNKVFGPDTSPDSFKNGKLQENQLSIACDALIKF